MGRRVQRNQPIGEDIGVGLDLPALAGEGEVAGGAPGPVQGRHPGEHVGGSGAGHPGL